MKLLVYSAALFSGKPRLSTMSDQNDTKHSDGMNDAIAATAIIAIVVITVAYWLSGMPS